MRKVYVAGNGIVSPLGFTTKENMSALNKGVSGIKKISDSYFLPVDFHASIIDDDKLDNHFLQFADPFKYTKFEKICISSVKASLDNSSVDASCPETLFILSTTKGSIDVLNKAKNKSFEKDRLLLWKSAQIISTFFGNKNTPLVISNACISGVLAIIAGVQILHSGRYNSVVVCGADIVTDFVVSGFQSFKALGDLPCRPFDKERNGLTLGEAAGTIVLTAQNETSKLSNNIVAGSGFSANDATHISAPSRTGEGLFRAISKVINAEQKIIANGIDYISAHGTATIYNDEMEAAVLNRLGLQNVPTNSFKGYWGHTLGAAGMIDSIAGLHSLQNNVLYKTAGFSELGTTQKVNIIENTFNKTINNFLKLASGFGGCNAAMLFYKENK